MEPPSYSEVYFSPSSAENLRFSSSDRVADLQDQVTQLKAAISKIDPGVQESSVSPSPATMDNNKSPLPVDSMFNSSNNNDRIAKSDAEDIASNRSTETSPCNAEETNWRYDAVDGERKQFLDSSAILEESMEDGGETSSNASTPQRPAAAPKMNSYLERAKHARAEAINFANGEGRSATMARRREIHSESSSDSDDDRIFEPTAVRANSIGSVSSAGGEMRSARSMFLQHLRNMNKEEDSEEYSLDDPPRPPRKDHVLDDNFTHDFSRDELPIKQHPPSSFSGAKDSRIPTDTSYLPTESTSYRYVRMGPPSASVGRALPDRHAAPLQHDPVHRGHSSSELDGGGNAPPYPGKDSYSGKEGAAPFIRSQSYTLGSSLGTSTHMHSYAEELARRNSDSFNRYMANNKPAPERQRMFAGDAYSSKLSDAIKYNTHTHISAPIRESKYASESAYANDALPSSGKYDSSFYSEGGTGFSPPAPARRKGLGDAPLGSEQARAGVYEFRCRELEKRLQQAEGEAALYADSLSELHVAFKAAKEEALEVRKKEKALQAQVDRLQVENRRHASNRTAVEKLFTQKVELAQSERDMLALQLATAYEEIQVRDAALADSAAYMQALRRRNAELQVQVRALLVDRCSMKDKENSDAGGDEDASGVFGLANIKAKIEDAVKELANVSESERKDRIKALRLRWHPDKNSVLQEFATEVTKIINEAIRKLPT